MGLGQFELNPYPTWISFKWRTLLCPPEPIYKINAIPFFFSLWKEESFLKKALNFYALPLFSNQIPYVLMPKLIKFFIAYREERFLLLQVSIMLKIYSVNLFGTWKVGAPKVDTPSSHVMSFGPLFIGDAPYYFLLKFLI